MSQLSNLKRMKIPKYRSDLSYKDYETMVFIAGSTKSKAKEVFDGTIKQQMDDNRKKKADGQNGLGADRLKEQEDENNRA